MIIERSKRDMNEFVDVTRKDLTELVHTVQQEHSTTVESTLPPLPASVNSTSADIFERVSHVVEGIKQEITEAATGKPTPTPTTTSTTTTTTATTDSEASTSKVAGEGSSTETEAESKPEDRKVAGGESEASTTTTTTATEEESHGDEKATTTPKDEKATATPISRGERASSLSFANTASLLSAGANTLTQTLSSSTREISSTANELFTRKLPAVAEKHLGDADLFFKNTTETLKSNGLLAEQYVNKLGAGMANFLNSAVVVSAPEEKVVAPRSRKMLFDRKAAMLEKLRTDPETYTVDPMTTIVDNDIVGLERYKYFLQTFNTAEYQQRISRLLNEYPEVKALMKKLVPAEVADEELFWLRYYFRLFEIEEEEKRRKKLVQEAGVELAEEVFTWDDNEDEDEDEDDNHEEETSGGQGSITPKAEQKNLDTVTPRASQILSQVPSKVKQDSLIAEELASSLAALPIPSDDDITTGSDKKAASGSDDEWSSEKSPSAPSFSVKSSLSGFHSKSSTTNASSTRTSSDTYEVVDGTETPVRAAPMAASVTSISSAPSSPAPTGQPAQHPSSSNPKSSESKEEDDWSDWE
ncbi:hypothetical protein BGZ65_008257 [Modicella reniformis]|uniref:BSD domain-containing protein n=1 Tax=Modicella reniformis TaxID=1440133 RepID=A0A9P6M7J5_9FUNG|nr:hypothetical protein BGZ65_008257 [Modicella reniformis]